VILPAAALLFAMISDGSRWGGHDVWERFVSVLEEVEEVAWDLSGRLDAGKPVSPNEARDLSAMLDEFSEIAKAGINVPILWRGLGCLDRQLGYLRQDLFQSELHTPSGDASRTIAIARLDAVIGMLGILLEVARARPSEWKGVEDGAGHAASVLSARELEVISIALAKRSSLLEPFPEASSRADGLRQFLDAISEDILSRRDRSDSVHLTPSLLGEALVALEYAIRLNDESRDIIDRMDEMRRWFEGHEREGWLTIARPK
jgi:hypothetical protein